MPALAGTSQRNGICADHRASAGIVAVDPVTAHRLLDVVPRHSVDGAVRLDSRP
jgi:hypothetical protein